MLKDLQKQIEKQKKELLKPLIEEMEQIFQGFEIMADFDTEGTQAYLSAQAIKGDSKSIVNFAATKEDSTFSVLSFKHIVENGIVMGVTPTPFTVSNQVINYVFYKLAELLESLQPKEEKEEIETKEED